MIVTDYFRLRKCLRHNFVSKNGLKHIFFGYNIFVTCLHAECILDMNIFCFAIIYFRLDFMLRVY